MSPLKPSAFIICSTSLLNLNWWSLTPSFSLVEHHNFLSAFCLTHPYKSSMTIMGKTSNLCRLKTATRTWLSYSQILFIKFLAPSALLQLRRKLPSFPIVVRGFIVLSVGTILLTSFFKSPAKLPLYKRNILQKLLRRCSSTTKCISVHTGKWLAINFITFSSWFWRIKRPSLWQLQS